MVKDTGNDRESSISDRQKTAPENSTKIHILPKQGRLGSRHRQPGGTPHSWGHYMKRLAIFVVLLIGPSACVAVWGRSYEVQSATSEGVVIKYDTNFTTLGDIQMVADRSCAESGRKAMERGNHKSLWQISTATFECVKPTGSAATAR